MGNKIKILFKFIDTVSEKAGRAFSLVVLVLMAIITMEVVARYVFNSPTIWAHTISRQVFGVFILFAGMYAMLVGAHLRVEVLYNRFSPRTRFYTGLVDLAAFLIFMGILVWQSGWLAGNSIMNREFTFGTFKIPLYIFKTFIPVVAFLFLLQGISAFFRKAKEPDSG